MATEWSMPRAGEHCVQCERPFDIGQVFQAVLFADETGYRRADYCAACAPEVAEQAIAVWKARRQAPSTPKAQPFDREAIFGFFERLADATDGPRQQFRFVLALLLWRKRVLKLERTYDDAARQIWEFHVVRTGGAHAVVRPDLDESRLEELSAQLEALLTGGEGGEFAQLAQDAAPAEEPS